MMVEDLSKLSWNELNGLWDQLLVWDEQYPVRLGHRMYLVSEEMDRRVARGDCGFRRF